MCLIMKVNNNNFCVFSIDFKSHGWISHTHFSSFPPSLSQFYWLNALISIKNTFGGELLGLFLFLVSLPAPLVFPLLSEPLLLGDLRLLESDLDLDFLLLSLSLRPLPLEEDLDPGDLLLVSLSLSPLPLLPPDLLLDLLLNNF